MIEVLVDSLAICGIAPISAYYLTIKMVESINLEIQMIVEF